MWWAGGGAYFWVLPPGAVDWVFHGTSSGLGVVPHPLATTLHRSMARAGVPGPAAYGADATLLILMPCVCQMAPGSPLAGHLAFCVHFRWCGHTVNLSTETKHEGASPVALLVPTAVAARAALLACTRAPASSAAGREGTESLRYRGDLHNSHLTGVTPASYLPGTGSIRGAAQETSRRHSARKAKRCKESVGTLLARLMTLAPSTAAPDPTYGYG